MSDKEEGYAPMLVAVFMFALCTLVLNWHRACSHGSPCAHLFQAFSNLVIIGSQACSTT